MQLSKQALEDFKKRYKQKFDIELSDSEANDMGVKLLQLFNIIYRPIPRKEKEKK